MGRAACPAPSAGPSAASSATAVDARPAGGAAVLSLAVGAAVFSPVGGAEVFSPESGAAVFSATGTPASPVSPVESHMAAGGEVKTSVALPSVADIPPPSVAATLSPDDWTEYSIRLSSGLFAASGVLTTRTWRKPSVVAVILRSTSGSTSR